MPVAPVIFVGVSFVRPRRLLAGKENARFARDAKSFDNFRDRGWPGLHNEERLIGQAE
jgi:hypothetical protein